MNENTIPEFNDVETPSNLEIPQPSPLPLEQIPAFSNYPPPRRNPFTKIVYLSFLGFAFLILILGLYLKKTSTQTAIIQPPVSTNNAITSIATPPPNQCVLYAVLESGDNDSQIITIDPKTKATTPLGDIQKGMQIENIAFDLRTKTLFANSSNAGQIYVIDIKTGIFSLIGQAHSGEISGFTIHPNGSQWGWAKQKGLIEIYPLEQTDTLLYPSLKRGSALTWDTAGTLLYGTFKDNNELFTYDTNKKTYTPLAYNLPTATRGLSMLSGDILLGINSEKEGTLHLYEFDPVNKLVTKEVTIETPESEPRGVAWDPSCGDPL